MQKIRPLKIVKTLLNNLIAAKESGYEFKYKAEIFRVLSSLYLKSVFCKERDEVTQKMFGYKVTAYEYKNLLYLFREVFLSKEYFFNADKVNPAIIDCGANIGMAILYFKFLYPDCSIKAFEPNPPAYYLLKKNVTQNNLLNVELYNLALSNSEGEIDFFTNGRQGMLIASVFKERGGQESIAIQAKKLSEFMGNSTYDLLKMDIEGAEADVLEDLIASGRINNVEACIIEYHHRIEYSKKSLTEFIRPFEERGFGYNIKTTFHKLGSFQDILLYLFRENSKSEKS